MQHISSSAGATVSYDTYGSGPRLVLVHGGFSDHKTNWEFVKPLFEQQFTVYAIARRGRGETDATEGHSLEDESMDVVAVIQSIGDTGVSPRPLLRRSDRARRRGQSAGPRAQAGALRARLAARRRDRRPWRGWKSWRRPATGKVSR